MKDLQESSSTWCKNICRTLPEAAGFSDVTVQQAEEQTMLQSWKKKQRLEANEHLDESQARPLLLLGYSIQYVS